MNYKSSPKKQNIAERLVDEGFCTNLNQAKALIMSGSVRVRGERIDKAGALVEVKDKIEVQTKRFVSRGGDKLYGALKELKLLEAFRQKIVADLGASTGGFTDVSLQLGAQKVFAVEQGFNQLDWKLRSDPKVTSFEKTDFRDISPPESQPIDWIVADLSFVSLRYLWPHLRRWLNAPHSQAMILFKPQFEVDAAHLESGGVVRNPQEIARIIGSVIEVLQDDAFYVQAVVPSVVKGTRGNQEYFVWISPATSTASP